MGRIGVYRHMVILGQTYEDQLHIKDFPSILKGSAFFCLVKSSQIQKFKDWMTYVYFRVPKLDSASSLGRGGPWCLCTTVL